VHGEWMVDRRVAGREVLHGREPTSARKGC
jgi:hypothetical protein